MVVPRWEWRTFGTHFGEVERGFEAMPVVATVESDELYVLSAAGRDIVKLREALIDVKHLHQVSNEGLEQWSPVLKAPFPLSAADVAVVADALGVDPPPDPSTAGATLDSLLTSLAHTPTDVRAVPVHKRRTRFTVGGCPAEVTEVRTEHDETRSIAVEHEDPQRVLAVLRELGLSSRPNVSYGRGLKILERFGTERFAVIDVGTNSVKFHVGERDQDGRWRTVVDRAVVTRLGEGLERDGVLGDEPMARTVDAIAGMADEARAAGAGVIVAVGTAGLRIASNSGELVRDVAQRCGVELEVISGADEARLAYRAATAGLPAAGTRLVFDTGGGSSQFTFGDGDRVDERFSVDVGAVRFTERFGLDGAVPREKLDEALGAIAADLGSLDGRAAPDSVLAMGGAVTNLAAVKHGLAEYDPDVVQGTVLDRGELDRQIELFRGQGAEERRAIVGLQPARAEVILAGACIVRTVLDKLGQESLTVSDRGLRYGVLADRFDPGGRACRPREESP